MPVPFPPTPTVLVAISEPFLIRKNLNSCYLLSTYQEQTLTVTTPAS